MMLRVLAALSVMVASGCECVERTSRVTGAAAWRAEPGILVEGDHAAIDFGTVPLGQFVERTAFVESIGRGPVILSAAGGTGPFGWNAVDQVAVSPGLSLGILIRFEPVAEGRLEEVLTVATEGTPAPRTLTLRLSGTGRGQPMMEPVCHLETHPDALRFGVLQEGESSTRTVSLVNDGDAPCLISQLVVTGVAFELVSQVASVAPHSALGLSVRARGQLTRGFSSGELRFAVTDPASPRRVVPLSAESVARCFEISPAPLDFGPTQLGCTRTRTVTVYNTCEAPLRLSETTVLDGPFAVDAGPASSLAIGEARSQTVSFTPTAPGPASGWLSLTLNDGTRLHALEGEGVTAAPVTEAFVQPAVQRVDILFSVAGLGGGWWNEDSGTNALSQPFRARMAGAIEALSDAGVDVHAGVIAGHWDREVWEFVHPDPLVPPPPWVIGQLIQPPGSTNVFAAAGPSAGAFVDSALREATWRGYFASMNGSSCFEAALRALTGPLSTTLNAGFRRPGTALAIVCQSFDGDVSTDLRPDSENEPPTPWTTPLPVPYYWQQLSTAAGGSTLLTVSAITSVPGGPICPFIGDSQGRFGQMASLSGGTLIDACDQDLALAIERLRQSVLAINRRFSLAGRPSATASLSVRLNGSVVSMTDWQYLAQTNTVELSSAPPSGAVIEVTYVPACP